MSPLASMQAGRASLAWCRIGAEGSDEIGPQCLGGSQHKGVYICPEAWYLSRFGRQPDAEAVRRIQAGTRAHRRIGRTTEWLARTDQIRRILLVALILLGLVLVSLLPGLNLAAISSW